MPNLRPPVDDGRAGAGLPRAHPRRGAARASRFEPLMTLYLTDTRRPTRSRRARDAGVVAIKLYPAGATTQQRRRRHRPAQDLRDARGDAARRHAAAGPRRGHRSGGRRVRSRGGLHRAPADRRCAATFPALKIVLEHITTREARAVRRRGRAAAPAATITAHHLLYNRNAIFIGGIRPHYYCLPVLKREEHRRALVAAATSRQRRASSSAPTARRIRPR